MSEKIRFIGSFLILSLILCLAGCFKEGSDQEIDRLSEILSTTYADLPEAFGEVRYEHSEKGGSPVCSLGKTPGVLVVYSGSEFPPDDERLPDELILTADYSEKISGVSVGDDLSGLRDMTFDDTWFSLDTGTAGLSRELGDLTLTLSVACEPGTTPTEENSSAEWDEWRKNYLAAPTGRVDTMRLRKTDRILPTLAVSIDGLSGMMERIEKNENYPSENYDIHITGMSTPVTLTMQMDLVQSIAAYGQEVRLKSPVDIYGNCNFGLFEADGAVIIEGGGSYSVYNDIYVISPGKHTMIEPGDTESYYLIRGDDGKLRYQLTTNHYADIIQTGALSVATGYDYFLYAVGDAAIVNGEVVFSGPDESYTVSDKYDLEREFEEKWTDCYDSLDELFTANRVESEPAPESVKEEIDRLPKARDEALISASPVGMNPSYFLFEPGMTFFQYDKYRDSYHECTLNLPEGFTGGSIISMTSGGGSGEMFMIVKAEHGDDTAYLDYYFYSGDESGGLDPLWVDYLDKVELTRLNELITLTSAVENRASSVYPHGRQDYSSMFDLLSYSTWYHYFIDGNEKMLCTLEFDASGNEMSWNIGWFESEWKNTFSGALSIDESGVFHGELYDGLRDEKIGIDFAINIIKSDADSGELDMTFTALSLDKYKSLAGSTVRFSQDAAPRFAD